METKTELISDLKRLINILNDGKEGYGVAGEATANSDLKAVFLKYSVQRAGFAQELSDHIAEHGGELDNAEESGSGPLSAWLDVKQAISGKEDTAILAAIETAEQKAIESYDRVIKNIEIHKDHIVMLQRQRTGIQDALRKVEVYHQRLLK
ncbi:PA2169 family four-helix-bundle protein [Pedobacter nyackensis]|uniref:DUF2383 domain-containing protein n=1 Tax=Pedobacter nyackensis TaxID=475255 RepID=A0A1W2BCH7_9SPHI|nr:PA2169 family four-helix-bundle protein [Pedobacter nyackensis]SMC70470.1 conserved hypothetical protein [Pedobacter nyackensis]